MAQVIDNKTKYTPTGKIITQTSPVSATVKKPSIPAYQGNKPGGDLKSFNDVVSGRTIPIALQKKPTVLAPQLKPTLPNTLPSLTKEEKTPYTPPKTTTEPKVNTPQPSNQGKPQTGSASNNFIVTGKNQPTDLPIQTQEPSMKGGGGGGFTGIRNDYASASAGDKAEMAAMMEGMLTYIDQMGGTVMNQIKGQMGMDDPETANAIAMIKQEADTIYKEMLEDLNSKGLVQSGIYAEAQDRIAKSQGMQVSNFVAQRFGDLQNQLNQAMMSIGQMRVSAMSNNMGMMNSNNMNDRNTMASIGMQGLQNDTQVRGQNIQNQQFQQSFDWQKQVDDRNFDYGQQRDLVGDQQFGQQLAASGVGSGNNLAAQQFQYMKDQDALYNRNEGFKVAQQIVANPPKTDAEYATLQYQISYNPMLQDPEVKAYLQNAIQKPVAQQTNTLGGLFGLNKPSGYAPPYQLQNQR